MRVRVPDLQLPVDHLRKLLLITLQEVDGLLQRFKHGVGTALMFFHGQ